MEQNQFPKYCSVEKNWDDIQNVSQKRSDLTIW
jgi:hypothetical protein